ncbi:putative E3 ubiquitin-protein ligase RF298 [Curcuma longa]|uniref:putative E3 ubiquitin-protein ligase RF298 n=1 Tax=Curcuma longa TaxID=136217 RepID=UPI003D9F4098
MAAVVASGNSPVDSSIAIQETGSRNKRKFQAEPPMADPSVIGDALQNNLCNYDVFPVEKPAELSDLDHHAGICDMCRTQMFGPKEGLDVDDFQDVDWSCLTESQLEEILLNNLDTVFRAAIKMITFHGHTEEVATNAVLRSGLCYGYKDTVSNVVDNALALLKSSQELDSSPRENIAEDLRHLEKSVLADMVSVLREVRPFFSTGDAMWRLLMSDANISHACAMDSNSSNAITSNEYSGASTIAQLEAGSISNNNATSTASELNVQISQKLHDIIPPSKSIQKLEIPKVAAISTVPTGKFSDSNEDGTISKPKPLKESLISLSTHVEESLSISNRKAHPSSLKREYVLRQKSIHSEKSFRALGSKAVSRACKQSGLGSLIFDRKLKTISDSSRINLKSSSLKIAKIPETEKSLTDDKHNLSYSQGNPSNLTYTERHNCQPTGLTLSLPSANNTCLSIAPESNAEATNCSDHSLIGSSMTCRDLVPEDKKDEMLLILVPLMQELQAQLQDWTDWAQQKVMQAARRLSKDKAELQSLRQEREEVARLKGERYALEDNTKKKLAEMELAISKASTQVERANAAAHRLKYENSQLRLEMEEAKLHAAQSATNCQESSRREMKALKIFQSWEKQKVLFQEELATEKHQLFQLQQQLEQVEELRNQSEARWKQEEKLKNAAIAVANAERKEREQLETSAKSQENALRFEAENDLQRCKNEIRKLEQQIAQLRLVKDSTNLTALQWGTDKSYASRLSDGRKNVNAHILANFIDSQETEMEELQRERECVMCLSEEMSVVFLPCAHQVVCVKCNELHEKQGMKDCPSCRTPIQRRVPIRFSA